MYGVVLTIHIVISFLLIIIILVQGGRGGMAEAFGGSGAQSLFGGGGNVVMTRVTAVAVGIFFVTSLSLAKLSTARGRSVIDQLPFALPEAADVIPGIFPEVSVEEPIVPEEEPRTAESVAPNSDAFPAAAAPEHTHVVPEALPSEDDTPLE